MKKTLPFLCFICLLFQAKASDTLTIRQVFNFNVGDTFDYATTLSMGFQGAPGLSGGFNGANYSRYVITHIDTSANLDTITYTRLMLYPNTQTDYLQYYNLDSPIWFGFDTLIDSPYLSIYISSLSDGRITNALTYNNTGEMVNYTCEFGQGVGVVDTITGGIDWQVDPFNEIDLVGTYRRSLIYFSKGSDHSGSPYYIANGSGFIHYTPIPEDCAYWSYSQYPGPGEPITYQVRTGAKVYSNSHTYVELIYRSYINNIISSDSTLGYFRNDSAGHKVYFTHTPGSGESLLYDFTLGPSANITNPIFSSLTLDTVEAYGQRRTIWTENTIDPFGNSTTSQTIEGVGAAWGLFSTPGTYSQPYNMSPVFSPVLVSLCTCDSTNPAYGQCQLLTSINKIPNTSSIHLYPNPTSDQLHLSIISMNSSAYQLILTDILGQEVYSSSIAQSETTHDISGLSSGIYTWRISPQTPEGGLNTNSNGSITTGKVIKE